MRGTMKRGSFVLGERGYALAFFAFFSAAVESACVGVQNAAGLQSAVDTVAAGATVTICNEIEVTSTITVKQSISFVGQCPYPGCHIYSSGLGAVRLFQINGGVVKFQSLWLDGGYAMAPFTDGVLCCLRTGGLNGCPSSYENDNGGAIDANSGTTVVADSVVFTSNSACNHGGAINTGGNANISNCLFLNNTAQDGGAISFSAGAVVTVRNSNFSYNIARDRASTFWMYQVASADIQGNLFLYNQALGWGGGAIVAFAEESAPVYTNNILIAGNTFAKNTWLPQPGQTVGGGAVLVHNADPSNFTANQADDGSANVLVNGSNLNATTNICAASSWTANTPGLGLQNGGAVHNGCGPVNCAVHNPCDPQATCTNSASPNLAPPTCTCPAGVNGDGWICESGVKLLAVGATVPFVVPQALDLKYGSNVTNIATVIGPSPNGSPVVLPPSLLTPQSSSKKRSETGVIVGIVVALVVAAILVCVAFGIHCYCRNRKRHELPLLTWDSRDLSKESWESRIASALGREAQVNQALGRSWRRFTHAELSEATGGFSREALLGEGAFGQVFLATWPDGTRLAVKKLKDGAKEFSEREFLHEVDALGRVRHRNLVSLRGYCVTDVECFLVLEYAENGNLDTALRSRSKPLLDWDTRLNIAVGAARGLSYLHNDTDPRIIHRDIKSANILLDAKMQAQVADFGLAKLVEGDQPDKSTMVRGTYGYLAPEMVYNGRVTPKSDVYSFGVVLLEIATGFRAIENAPDGFKQNLAEAVFRNQHQLLVTMDSRLNGLFPREEATRLLTIALTCVAKRDSARPEMIEVLRGLESISGGVSIPADPPPKEDASQEDAESWFGSSLRDSESSADGLSIRSHSTWSQLSSTGNTGHSLNYQMTMIHEGR